MITNFNKLKKIGLIFFIILLIITNCKFIGTKKESDITIDADTNVPIFGEMPERPNGPVC